MKVLDVEQNEVHAVSGRKRQNYQIAEAKFQAAQSKWEADENDKRAWDEMWLLIQNACFNNMNKKLEHILPQSEIEARALDATIDVMKGLRKKRELGREWKIGKVSSYVHLYCVGVMYDERTKFHDKLLLEDSFIDQESGEVMGEFYYDTKDGVYK